MNYWPKQEAPERAPEADHTTVLHYRSSRQWMPHTDPSKSPDEEFTRYNWDWS